MACVQAVIRTIWNEAPDTLTYQAMISSDSTESLDEVEWKMVMLMIGNRYMNNSDIWLALSLLTWAFWRLSSILDSYYVVLGLLGFLGFVGRLGLLFYFVWYDNISHFGEISMKGVLELEASLEECVAWH